MSRKVLMFVLGFVLVLLSIVVRGDLIDVAEQEIVHVDEGHSIEEVFQDEEEVVEEISTQKKKKPVSSLFVPQCNPACSSSEFCNFKNECEKYPILILECGLGEKCHEGCHCSYSCDSGLCMKP